MPEDYQIYLKDMERSGTWGDHVTLKAAADVYGVRIIVLSSYDNHEASIIEVDPEIRFSRRVLYLSFWAEVRKSLDGTTCSYLFHSFSTGREFLFRIPVTYEDIKAYLPSAPV